MSDRTAATGRPLAINRARREFLTALTAGRVYRSLGGCVMWQVRAGQNRRCETRLRELQAAGLALLEPDENRRYAPTADGLLALERAA